MTSASPWREYSAITVCYVFLDPMHNRQTLSLFAFLMCASPASAQFGDLAPGAAIYWRLAGVRAEAGVAFAMDPAHLAGRLPSGLRVATLGARAARGDSSARAMIGARPDLANYVITVLAISRVDSLQIEGDAAPAQKNLAALWWVPAQVIDTSSAPPDDRARRGEQQVELAFWSTGKDFMRRLHTFMPSAAPAEISMQWNDGDSTWTIRLVVPGATVLGTCRLHSPAIPANYPLPQYSTVWSSGSKPRAFVVYTYYGHQTQPCSGAWHATGSGAIARALHTGVVLGAVNQTGWRARAGAYLPR